MCNNMLEYIKRWYLNKYQYRPFAIIWDILIWGLFIFSIVGSIVKLILMAYAGELYI